MAAPTPGRYLRLRRILGFALIAVFVGLPHLPIGGKPAILLDLAARQFTFFGLTLHPTDNLILAAFGGCLAITVLLVTAVLGRVWCGYACPQLVYMELVYRPIERFFARRRLAAGKWLVWALIAFGLALTFVAYFTGFSGAVAGLSSSPAVLATVLAVTGLQLLDFGLLREYVCVGPCPYGRLQNVLYDRDTVIVGYDEARGEPRRGAGEPQGDCIDCRRCTATCPMGIDIRDGLQLECVGCAQCADSCDAVMARSGKAPGLVRYTSLNQLAGGVHKLLRPRVLLYAALLVVLYATFWTFVLGRAPATVEIVRGSRDPYRTTPAGEVANQVRARLTNRLDEPQAFIVALLAPEGTLTASLSPYVLGPHEVGAVDLVVRTAPDIFRKGRAEARFHITSDRALDEERDFVLVGPYRREAQP